MTYYDRLNKFYNELPRIKLKPSSQLLYLHLLQINNEFRWVQSFYFSDRALSERTGMSLRTISESKAVLKNFGLIDFKTVNHKTKYFLQQVSEGETLSETPKMQNTIQKPQVRPNVTVSNDIIKEEQNRMRPRKMSVEEFNRQYEQRVAQIWKSFS